MSDTSFYNDDNAIWNYAVNIYLRLKFIMTVYLFCGNIFM